MKPDFWKCPWCESENPCSATVCGTCSLIREPDELTGITHRQHLAAALANESRWRIDTTGPGYVVVGARSRAVAEAKGAELLKQDALADQSVVVTEIRRRDWLVYVRSELTPYPSALKPWQAETSRRATPTVPSREPAEGRAYIGRVFAWSRNEGCGSIRCSDRRIGEVAVRRSDLDGRQEEAMRAGQHVGFKIKKTPDGLFATDIVPLGPLVPAG